MAFEFGNLSDNTAFEAEYRPHKNIAAGQGLQLELNQDIITADFLEQSASSIRKMIPEEDEQPTPEESKEAQTKEVLKTNLSRFEDSIKEIRSMARVLGGKPGSSDINDRVIRKWNMIRGGETVEISFEELYGWKFSDLQKLYMFCVYEASAVKKTKSGKSKSS